MPLLAAPLLLAALLPTAGAWDTTGAAWPAEAFPVPYQVQAGDLSIDNAAGSWTDEEVLAAIQAGMETWSEVACAPGVSFVYEGRLPEEASYGDEDGRNGIFLVTDGWPEEPGLVSSPVIYTAGTELVEVDFALNLQEYLFAVDGADGRTVMDVQAAVVHEGGHVLGLWHSDVVGASLNPSMDGNPEARTLAEDDIEGLCSLYEGAGGGDGAADVGEACVTADDCADGLSCLVDGGERYCTEACASDDDCPADMVCADLGTGEQVCAFGEAEEGCGCTGVGGVGGLALAGLALLGAGLRRRVPGRA